MQQETATDIKTYFPKTINEYDDKTIYELIPNSESKTIEYDDKTRTAYDITSKKYRKLNTNFVYTVSSKKINSKITDRWNLKKFGDETNTQLNNNSNTNDIEDVFMNYNSEIFKSHQSRKYIRDNIINPNSNERERIATISKKDDKVYENVVNSLNIKDINNLDNMLYVDRNSKNNKDCNNIFVNAEYKTIICRKCNGNHYTINCVIINIVAEKPLELKTDAKKIYIPKSIANKGNGSSGNNERGDENKNIALYISGFDENTNYDDLRDWISENIGNNKFKLIYKNMRDNAIIKFNDKLYADDALVKLNKTKFNYTIILAEWAKSIV